MRRALLAGAIVTGLTIFPRAVSAADLGVQITSPPSGAVLSGAVEITAETVGEVPSVRFEVSLDGGLTWSLVSTDDVPGDGWSASWDTAGYSGPAVLRASVSDGTGAAESTVDVTVEEAPAPVLTVDRPAFSPNGDGRADQTTISLELSEPVNLEVFVENAAGSVVHLLLDGENVEAGHKEVAWDGSSGTGRTLPDGDYRVVAEATDAAGEVGTAEAAVTIDTRAPRFLWRRIAPDPYLGVGQVRFAFSVSDQRPSLTVTAAIVDSAGRLLQRVSSTEVPTGATELRWNGRDARGHQAEPGLFRVTVRVRDDAGNLRTSPARPFRDHRPVGTRVIRRVDGSGPRVALTFDDCNSADAWGRILQVLDAKHAGASFFCPGLRVAAFPALAVRTIAAGHTIGSHGWDHADLTTLTVNQIRERLHKDSAAWWRQDQVTAVPFFRPPYGAYDAETLRAAGDEGYRYTVLWNVDPRDWTRPGVSEIVDRVLSHARRGSIVVLHVQDQTAAALPAILDGLRRRGLEPVTLAELIAAGEH